MYPVWKQLLARLLTHRGARVRCNTHEASRSATRKQEAARRIRRRVLRTRAAPSQQIDCATAQTRGACFLPGLRCWGLPSPKLSPDGAPSWGLNYEVNCGKLLAPPFRRQPSLEANTSAGSVCHCCCLRIQRLSSRSRLRLWWRSAYRRGGTTAIPSGWERYSSKYTTEREIGIERVIERDR